MITVVDDDGRRTYVHCEDCRATAPLAVWQHESDLDMERRQFEIDIFIYYQSLKAKCWSAPEEGSGEAASLLWREPSGKYGVQSVEAAWNGWRMRAVR